MTAPPAQGRSEPRAEDVPDEIWQIARHAYADTHWPDGRVAISDLRNPWTALRDALAAVIPAVRAQVAAEITDEANMLRAEAERLEHGNRLDRLEAIGVSVKAGHLEHAAKIARGDQ